MRVGKLFGELFHILLRGQPICIHDLVCRAGSRCHGDRTVRSFFSADGHHGRVRHYRIGRPAAAQRINDRLRRGRSAHIGFLLTAPLDLPRCDLCAGCGSHAFALLLHSIQRDDLLPPVLQQAALMTLDAKALKLLSFLFAQIAAELYIRHFLAEEFPFLQLLQ